jgi:hypothetical protein
VRSTIASKVLNRLGRGTLPLQTPPRGATMMPVEAGRQARAARLAAMTPEERVALAVRFAKEDVPLAAYTDDPTG